MHTRTESNQHRKYEIYCLLVYSFKSHIMVIKTASCHRRKEEKRPYDFYTHKMETLNLFGFLFLFKKKIFREKKNRLWNVVTDPIRNSSVTIDWSTFRVIVFLKLWCSSFFFSFLNKISKSNVCIESEKSQIRKLMEWTYF